MSAKILAVRLDEKGEAVVLMEVPPGDIGMRAVRLDQGPRVRFARAASFPPGAGEWFRHETGGGIHLGCPSCGHVSALTSPGNRVLYDGRVELGLRCESPGCSWAEMSLLLAFEPAAQGSCLTCSHALHPAPCGADCGCEDVGAPEEPVFKLETISQRRVAIAGEAELQREAARITQRAIQRAKSASR